MVVENGSNLNLDDTSYLLDFNTRHWLILHYFGTMHISYRQIDDGQSDRRTPFLESIGHVKKVVQILWKNASERGFLITSHSTKNCSTS